MTEHKELDDGTLLAFIEGRLDPAAAGRVSDAMAASPALRRRVDTMRAGMEAERDAFAAVLDSPLPPKIQAAAGAGRRRSWLHAGQWLRSITWALGAPAAAAAVGLIVGVLLWGERTAPMTGDGPSLADAGDGLSAGSDILFRALEQGPVTFEAEGWLVRVASAVNLPFEATCHPFQLSEGEIPASRGIACSTPAGWQVLTLAAPGAE